MKLFNLTLTALTLLAASYSTAVLASAHEEFQLNTRLLNITLSNAKANRAPSPQENAWISDLESFLENANSITAPSAIEFNKLYQESIEMVKVYFFASTPPYAQLDEQVNTWDDGLREIRPESGLLTRSNSLNDLTDELDPCLQEDTVVTHSWESFQNHIHFLSCAVANKEKTFSTAKAIVDAMTPKYEGLIGEFSHLKSQLFQEIDTQMSDLKRFLDTANTLTDASSPQFPEILQQSQQKMWECMDATNDPYSIFNAHLNQALERLSLNI